MGVITEIERLENAKADIKTAITNKGVSVPSGIKLDGLATLINDIQTGTAETWTFTMEDNSTLEKVVLVSD